MGVPIGAFFEKLLPLLPPEAVSNNSGSELQLGLFPCGIQVTEVLVSIVCILLFRPRISVLTIRFFSN